MIPNPADIDFVQETSVQTGTSQIRPYPVVNTTHVTHANNATYALQHGGGANLLFCDDATRAGMQSGYRCNHAF